MVKYWSPKPADMGSNPIPSAIFLKDKELKWASKDLNLHYYLIRVAS